MAAAFPAGPGAYSGGSGPAFGATKAADKPLSDFDLMVTSGGFLNKKELERAREQLERIKQHQGGS